VDAVRFKLLDYSAGVNLSPHCHEEGQILFAKSGTMEVTAAERLYIVPSYLLVWIPPGVAHGIRFRTETQMRTAFVDPAQIDANFSATRVFEASALFSELLIRLVEDSQLSARYRQLLEGSLVEELQILEGEEFSLKLPTDSRALRVALALISDPANSNNLTDWAQIAACSSKTLSRKFGNETGETFQQWRRRARLLVGLDFIDGGQSVGQAAHGVGFSTSSAFAEAHRLTFGYAPTKKPSANQRNPRSVNTLVE